MSYLDIARATQDVAFKARLQVAVYTAATNVLNESKDVPNHDLRQRLATEIIAGSAVRLQQFTWLAASSPAISSTVQASAGVVQVAADDQTIQDAVDTNWDAVAGWATR